MKYLQSIGIILFSVVILLPLVFFNFDSNAESRIDNRALAENPFQTEGDLTENIENYINDRIGFRDSMIAGYTEMNDALFGKMVHPTYTYGKDGYVFGSGITTTNDFGEYHIAFADMIKEMQDYCEARNIPFLFVFDPAKPAIYQDKIANGINYNRDWVPLFLAELDRRNINYLDNTETLTALRKNGIDGYNRKFDANHWNDMGAFYGTRAILQKMQEKELSLHVNDLSEFSVTTKRETSLPVSDFRINEEVPEIRLKASYEDLGQDYASELQMDPSYQAFGYCVNEERKAAGSPKVLMFQGSYMNVYGYKYMINACGEYIYVHDYQNVIDFPYYINIFQPDCVIFEVAEYTFSDLYFDYQKMKEASYNPSLSSLSAKEYSVIRPSNQDLSVEKGDTLTTITWKTKATYSFVWLKEKQIYDMKKTEAGYQVTVLTKDFEQFPRVLEICAYQ